MLSQQAKRKAEEARILGKWLYDPEYRNWYNPKRFEHTFSYANANGDFLRTLQIRDPREGIEAGFKRLAELEGKLKMFILQVNEYYQNKK